MDSSCVFCQIVAGTAPASVVYEDELSLAFMDIRPVTPGHVLVIPKAHHAYLADSPEPLWTHVCAVARRLARAVRAAGVRCEGVNIHLADGEAAGQEIFHCHVHVIARYEGDGFVVAARRPGHPSRGELDEIAQRIADADRRDLPA